MHERACSASRVPFRRDAGAAKGRGGGGAMAETLASPSAFWTATWRSYLVILCLEIGDRTFFIAALLSAKHPAGIVFVGAFGARMSHDS